MGANTRSSAHGVLTARPGTLCNDFFVNLMNMSTKWSKSASAEGLYEGHDRASGKLNCTATPVDLILGPHSGLAVLHAPPSGFTRTSARPGLPQIHGRDLLGVEEGDQRAASLRDPEYLCLTLHRVTLDFAECVGEPGRDLQTRGEIPNLSGQSLSQGLQTLTLRGTGHAQIGEFLPSILHQATPALQRFGRGRSARIESRQRTTQILAETARTPRQSGHLVCHDCCALPCRTNACSLDGGIEGNQ